MSKKIKGCRDRKPYDFIDWKVGTLLVDVDVDPHRYCVVVRAEDIKERPRIGVLYDNGERLECTHPGHYRELIGPDIRKLISKKISRRLSAKHKILLLVSRGILDIFLIDLLVDCDHVDIEILLEQMMVRVVDDKLQITILGMKTLEKLGYATK